MLFSQAGLFRDVSDLYMLYSDATDIQVLFLSHVSFLNLLYTENTKDQNLKTDRSSYWQEFFVSISSMIITQVESYRRHNR